VKPKTGRIWRGIRQQGQRERERERERARYCRLGREGENRDEGENSVVFKRGQHWLILTDGLNQHMGIFGYRR
jgi:hypothetical protein